jgi:hypothetical protein
MEQVGVVIGGHAHENARLASTKNARNDAGILQCLPAELQHQALLRVDTGSLAWRNTEELWVKAIYVIKKTATRKAGPRRD